MKSFESVIASEKITVICPHCDSTFALADEHTARAYISQHIQQEHSDKFPDE